jgi:putative colanic acid biosynthesis glycosyltransferase WcaI
MRILVAGANYAPETTSVAPFTTGLAEHFAMRGHEVIVATTFPFYPLWHWYERPPSWRTRQVMNGVEVWRTKILLPRRRTALSRIVFDCSIAVTTAITIFSIPQIDITICLSPPIQSTLVSAAIRRRIGKLVMLIQDLPTEAARSVGMLKNGLLVRLGTALERTTYARADHIVVISGSFAKYVRGLGVDSRRITQIPNWADVDTVQPSNPDQAVRARLGAAANDFLVVHSGNMGAKQDLTNVIAAAAILSKDSRVKIALVGDGAERANIESALRLSKLNNVLLLPLQSEADFPRVLAASDALLINQAPMVIDSVLPSKLLAYMAAGRPILAAVHQDSATADLVRRASCGVVTSAGQPAALAESIRAMVTSSESGRGVEMGKRGRSYVVEHFERDSILRQWDELLAGLS